MRIWNALTAAALLAVSPAATGVCDTGIGKGLMVQPDGNEHQQIGRVTGVDPASMTFNCHWRTGDWTYQTNAQTTFSKGGARATFADLTPGATVQVLFHFSGTAMIADAVSISQ